ncbi:hypothetical protein ACRABS_002154 [Salmonella enterica subsp. enterica]
MKEIVMYDSPEAASIQTLTGWVDRHGRFWGDDEHMARWSGSTHQKCERNPEHPIRENRGYCEACRDERQQALYMAMERQPWDGDTILHLHNTDVYFQDLESIRDHFCDDLPEDGELPSELQEAFDRLNEVIRKSPPLSWFPGEIAAILPDGILTAEERHDIEIARPEAAGVDDKS